MHAGECRTLIATCMHELCVCIYNTIAWLTACVCLFNIMSIELYTLHLNRVLVLFSSESVEYEKDTWLCHYITESLCDISKLRATACLHCH